MLRFFYNTVLRCHFKNPRMISALWYIKLFFLGSAAAAIHRTARAAAGAAAFAGSFIFDLTTHEWEDKKSYDNENDCTDKHRAKLGFFKDI